MDAEHRPPGVADDLGRDRAQPDIERLDEPAHRIAQLALVDGAVGLEPGLLVVARQIFEEAEGSRAKAAEADRRQPLGPLGQRFQKPCDGMRNARLKREDAFSHAMIMVSSAMVSSS